MEVTLRVFLLIVSAICFFLALINVKPNWNFIAAGLLFFVLTFLLK